MLSKLFLAPFLISGAHAQFTVWTFNCGGTMYTCGNTASVPAASQCKMRSPVTRTIAITSGAVCTKIRNEAMKDMGGDIYKSGDFCPNKKPVTSYAKYRIERESKEWVGKQCSRNKECKCCAAASGFGDPHFLQYDGKPFSYHGKCDLVLAHSAQFGNGLGLRVHGRTEIVDDWSRIRNAAVQIGEDTIELSNNGFVYLNGKKVDESMMEGATLAGVYNITKEIKIINDIPKTDITIRLNEDHKEKIKMSLFKKVINVHVGADEDDLQGMLGHKTIDGFVGRDQILMEDHVGMGDHWQVRDNEPMLFAEISGPQYPEQCILPDVDSRRLRKSEHFQRRAAEACEGIESEVMRKFCIEDIALSGDFDLAHVYHAGMN